MHRSHAIVRHAIERTAAMRCLSWSLVDIIFERDSKASCCCRKPAAHGEKARWGSGEQGALGICWGCWGSGEQGALGICWGCWGSGEQGALGICWGCWGSGERGALGIWRKSGEEMKQQEVDFRSGEEMKQQEVDSRPVGGTRLFLEDGSVLYADGKHGGKGGEHLLQPWAEPSRSEPSRSGEANQTKQVERSRSSKAGQVERSRSGGADQAKQIKRSKSGEANQSEQVWPRCLSIQRE